MTLWYNAGVRIVDRSGVLVEAMVVNAKRQIEIEALYIPSDHDITVSLICTRR